MSHGYPRLKKGLQWVYFSPSTMLEEMEGLKEEGYDATESPFTLSWEVSLWGCVSSTSVEGLISHLYPFI